MKARAILGSIPIVFLLLPLSSMAASGNEAKSRFEEGIALSKQRHFDEAIEKFTGAVLLSPETHQYHQALVFEYVRTRRGPQAIGVYRDLAQRFPQSGTVRYWLGRLYVESRELDDAVRELREAARLAPKDEHAYIALGHVYLRQGKEQEALDAYLAANRLAPRVALVHARIGDIYVNRKNYARARREYEQALKLDPSLIEARYNLSVIYEKSGDVARAVKELQALLEEDPNESRSRERLARIYFLGEQYLDAVREYATLSQVKQNSPQVFLALGESQIMLAAGRTDPAEKKQLKESAAQAFQRVLDLDPKNAQARRYLDRLKSPN